MSMDTLLVIAFLLVALIGAGIGSVLLFRNPAAWMGFATLAFKKLRPILIAYFLKRMPPEKEKEMQDCFRRGGVWDPVRKRCKR